MSFESFLLISSVVGLESAPGLQSDSSPYFWDSDSDLDLDPKDSDLDSDFVHETKVKAIHEWLTTDRSQQRSRGCDQYSATQSDSTPMTPTVVGEFRKYLELCEQGTSAHLSCLEFWQQQSSTFPRIHDEVAVRSLAVPAASAAVERVFSSGACSCNHTARLSNKTLSDLVFLKCNIDKL